MRGGRFHRPYPTLAHAAANAGQRHEHVPALGGLDIEPNDAELHHLVDRAVDRLPRHAEVAGDVRRAHDAADDIGHHHRLRTVDVGPAMIVKPRLQPLVRSEEHTSELQSLMRISYAVFCLKKKNTTAPKPNTPQHNHKPHNA